MQTEELTTTNEINETTETNKAAEQEDLLFIDINAPSYRSIKKKRTCFTVDEHIRKSFRLFAIDQDLPMATAFILASIDYYNNHLPERYKRLG